MMMTPIPAMKPATIGSDKKSASQPSLSSPMSMTISPGHDRGRGDEFHVLRRGRRRET